jgi:hypothetical protein
LAPAGAFSAFAGLAVAFLAAGLTTALAGFLLSTGALTLLVGAFTSVSTALDFLVVLAGADLAVATLVLLAGMTIPQKKAHRNGEMRGKLGKSIDVVWWGKLCGRTFGMQSLRWSDQMAQSICWSGPEVLLSRLP